MQNLAAGTDAQQHKLYLKRKEHHACHLMFVAQVYLRSRLTTLDTLTSSSLNEP